jgi:hypothetical protein
MIYENINLNKQLFEQFGALGIGCIEIERKCNF